MLRSRDTNGRFIKGHTMNLRHGMAGTPTYQAWNHARLRCENPNTKDYHLWGGRGIKFRWQSFDSFFAHMGIRPDGMTLERKNNDGDYEPGNCVWATRSEQARNRGSWVKLTLVEASAIKRSSERGVVLAARYGVSKSTITAIRKERIWRDA